MPSQMMRMSPVSADSPTALAQNMMAYRPPMISSHTPMKKLKAPKQKKKTNEYESDFVVDDSI